MVNDLLEQFLRHRLGAKCAVRMFNETEIYPQSPNGQEPNHKTHFFAEMLPTVKSSNSYFMVGYRRQKYCLVFAVSVVAVGLVLYTYSRSKTSGALKPLALIFASTRTQRIAGLQLVKDDNRLEYQDYENSVRFDRVSNFKVLYF